jgi:hypothetical protein
MPYRQPPPRRTKVLRFCLDVLAKAVAVVLAAAAFFLAAR